MPYDLQIGTMTVFMEASGEPDEGKLAVAYVLVNRLKTERWGKTLAAVCFAPHQFSSWDYTGPNMERLASASDIDPALAACEQAMSNAMHGTAEDPTKGALYYFADYIEPPKWAHNLTFTVHVGQHEFFK
jgi:spore germination cell wall hydrolase CwlJ-like protein